jgi:hypothetical protein
MVKKILLYDFMRLFRFDYLLRPLPLLDEEDDPPPLLELDREGELNEEEE